MAISAALALAVAGVPAPIRIHWDVPPTGPARGLVVLHHGFGRSPRVLDRLTGELVAAGLAVARPAVSALRRGRTYNDPDFLTAYVLALATALEAAAVTGDAAVPQQLAQPVPLVLAGHSAGSAAALHAAAVLRPRGGIAPAGLLLLDPTDSLAEVGTRALPEVDDVPVLVVAGPPSRCNRGAVLSRAVAARRVGFVGATVVHGGHGDAEGDTTRLYRWACGDASAPEDVALVHELATGWAGDLATGEVTAALRPGGRAFDAWVAADRVRPMLGAAVDPA